MNNYTIENNLEKCIKLIYKKKRIPRTIIEIGARDCNESIAFNYFFPNAKIYSFECNPSTLPICRQRIKDIKNITLIEKAVSDKNGMITFYPINQKETATTWKDGNPGASSLYKATKNYPLEKYVQDEIVVETITLKEFFFQKGIGDVDILWMDIQGAELIALKGAEEKINSIFLIHLEVEFQEIYHNQPLFWEIKKYLNTKRFYLIGFTSFSKYSADAVFININELKTPFLIIWYKLLNKILQPLTYYKYKLIHSRFGKWLD